MSIDLFLSLLAPGAQAGGFACNITGERPESVSIITSYTPTKGGMNGHCGTSASGWDTCKFLFKMHLQGKAPVVMAAVTQNGGSSRLFGSIYQADVPRVDPKTKEVIPFPPRFVNIMVGDHFHGMYNNNDKMDVALETDDPNDPEFVAINRLTQWQESPENGKLMFKPAFRPGTADEKNKGFTLLPCGLVPKFKNKDRKTDREKDAISRLVRGKK